MTLPLNIDTGNSRTLREELVLLQNKAPNWLSNTKLSALKSDVKNTTK